MAEERKTERGAEGSSVINIKDRGSAATPKLSAAACLSLGTESRGRARKCLRGIFCETAIARSPENPAHDGCSFTMAIIQ